VEFTERLKELSGAPLDLLQTLSDLHPEGESARLEVSNAVGPGLSPVLDLMLEVVAC